MPIQLKVKTEYSFGKTYAPISRLVEVLKEQGTTAAAIVDNSSWGHFYWERACREAGIKPMFGMELVVDDSDTTTRKMWFIARNREGLTELYAAATKAHTQPGAWNLPRLYVSDVEAMSVNILVFSGDYYEEDIIDRTRALLDVNPSSKLLRSRKERLAKKYDERLIPTCDNAYAHPDDRVSFQLISGRGHKPTIQHLIPIVNKDVQEVADLVEPFNLKIAPDLESDDEDLWRVCRNGAHSRKVMWDDVYEARLKRELGLIYDKNFQAYFMIVADMVNYAKQHMLVGPSRGSAAGSLVCYLTGITEVDPIKHNLFFERFIDENRSDMPDIDLDFPDNKRHLVHEYMRDKYGSARVAQLGTVIKYKPKSALIQACKRLNISPLATWAVKDAMIERSSADSRVTDCLLDTLDNTVPGQTFIKQYPEAKLACNIEGHSSHTGKHAAGLIVAPTPMCEYAVVDETGVAHLDKTAAESLNLLKIDILGLRTLTILEDVEADIDWYNLPLDDEKTYQVFNDQKLCGIFQFEGISMRSQAAQMHFNSIREVDAITALARPGPFSSGVTEKFLARHGGGS